MQEKVRGDSNALQNKTRTGIAFVGGWAAEEVIEDLVCCLGGKERVKMKQISKNNNCHIFTLVIWSQYLIVFKQSKI